MTAGEYHTIQLKLGTLLTASELAPDLYFTKERLTMMSDEGVKAIPGGVAVQIIGEQDGKFIVKEEKVQFMV